MLGNYFDLDRTTVGRTLKTRKELEELLSDYLNGDECPLDTCRHL